MQPAVPPLDVTTEELEALLEGVREALGEAGYQKLKAAIRTLSYVTQLLENREATLQTLRRLLCRARSEKTEAVLEQAGIPGSRASGDRPRTLLRKSLRPAMVATVPKRIAERSGSRFPMRRCTKGTAARSVSAARCTRCTIRAC